MEEDCDIDTKCAPEHQSDAPIQLPDTPRTRQCGFDVNMDSFIDSSALFSTNHTANPEKTPPRPMENVVVGNIATPEMVRRPLITTESEMQFEEGYDSDRGIGPFNDAIVEEGDQLLNEVEVPEMGSTDEIGDVSARKTGDDPPAVLEIQVPPMPPLPPVNIHVVIHPDVVEKFKVDELRHELKLRGQSPMGKKDELKARLVKALNEKIPVTVNVVTSGTGGKGKKGGSKKKDAVKSKIGRGFPLSAKWRPLLPDSEVVAEPLNPTFKLPRAPTITEQDAAYVPPKYNFSNYTFAIPKFTGSVERRRRIRKKRTRSVVEVRDRQQQSLPSKSNGKV